MRDLGAAMHSEKFRLYFAAAMTCTAKGAKPMANDSCLDSKDPISPSSVVPSPNADGSPSFPAAELPPQRAQLQALERLTTALSVDCGRRAMGLYPNLVSPLFPLLSNEGLRPALVRTLQSLYRVPALHHVLRTEVLQPVLNMLAFSKNSDTLRADLFDLLRKIKGGDQVVLYAVPPREAGKTATADSCRLHFALGRSIVPLQLPRVRAWLVPVETPPLQSPNQSAVEETTTSTAQSTGQHAAASVFDSSSPVDALLLFPPLLGFPPGFDSRSPTPGLCVVLKDDPDHCLQQLLGDARDRDAWLERNEEGQNQPEGLVQGISSKLRGIGTSILNQNWRTAPQRLLGQTRKFWREWWSVPSDDAEEKHGLARVGQPKTQKLYILYTDVTEELGANPTDQEAATTWAAPRFAAKGSLPFSMSTSLPIIGSSRGRKNTGDDELQELRESLGAYYLGRLPVWKPQPQNQETARVR